MGRYGREGGCDVKIHPYVSHVRVHIAKVKCACGPGDGNVLIR